MSDELKNKGIKTLRDDMSNAIDTTEEGFIRKLIHEQESLDSESRENSPQSKQNRKFLFVGLILFLLAVVTLVFFFVLKEKRSTVEIKPQYEPIIFTEETGFKEITGFSREEILGVIAGEAFLEDTKEGTINGLYLVENRKVIGLRRFLALIESKFDPGEPIFVSDNFFLGTFYNKDQNNFFAILEVRAFVDVFEMLRNWEDSMFRDIYPALGTIVDGNNNYLLNKKFEDGVIENKNARILYDKEGDIELMYIFAKENFIVLTKDVDTAHEVVLRLSSVKIKK